MRRAAAGEFQSSSLFTVIRRAARLASPMPSTTWSVELSPSLAPSGWSRRTTGNAADFLALPSRQSLAPFLSSPPAAGPAVCRGQGIFAATNIRNLRSGSRTLWLNCSAMMWPTGADTAEDSYRIRSRQCEVGLGKAARGLRETLRGSGVEDVAADLIPQAAGNGPSDIADDWGLGRLPGRRGTESAGEERTCSRQPASR